MINWTAIAITAIICTTVVYLCVVCGARAEKEANVKKHYYKTCPKCGAHLDPGERCDCEDESHG